MVFTLCRSVNGHQYHGMNPNCRKSDPDFWDWLHGVKYKMFLELEFTQDGQPKVFELLGRDPWPDETLSMCKVRMYQQRLS